MQWKLHMGKDGLQNSHREGEGGKEREHYPIKTARTSVLETNDFDGPQNRMIYTDGVSMYQFI